MQTSERWAVLKKELIAGAAPFESEQQALGEAAMRANKDDEVLVVLRVVAEVKRDSDPPAVITRFE